MVSKEKPLIYLNNAATSWPKPPKVLDAVRDSLTLPVFGSGRTTGTEGLDYATSARDELAKLLGVSSRENIIFTQNATDSLNILISGFLANQKEKIHVITTALEHNSVLRPLFEYERMQRIRLDILPFENGTVTPESVAKAIRPDTRLMVMTQASNVLGSVQDIKTIGELLQKRGVYFIVDGAQTAGHIPITLEKAPVDAFVFTGHKGLFGTCGIGGFYLREPEKIALLRFGGTGTNSASPYHPATMPERFTAGTENHTGLAALAAGVSFVREKTISSIANQAERQTGYLISELKKTPGITLYNEHPKLPIISFNIQGVSPDNTGFILARAYNIIGRTGLHCAPLVHKAINGGEGCVRLSLSCFTTDEECRTVLTAVREISKDANSTIHSA